MRESTEADLRQRLRAYQDDTERLRSEIAAARQALGDWSKPELGESLAGAINNLRQAEMTAMEMVLAYKAEVKRLREDYEALRAVLGAIEWIEHDEMDSSYCPACRFQGTFGHARSCILAAALRTTTAEEAPHG